MSSKRILHRKVVHEDGSILEVKVWQIPQTSRYPEGYKYSLYLVKGNTVLVGYDNHHPKGHHRHYGEIQESYRFTSIADLIRDFDQDRKRLHHES